MIDAEVHDAGHRYALAARPVTSLRHVHTNNTADITYKAALWQSTVLEAMPMQVCDMEPSPALPITG